ncbi:quinone oxidoreductase [Obelidium mucronatum]|nr:quinone oxidoreductase [Obelidium mucronatum]
MSLPATTRAIVIKKYGGPEVLEEASLPAPTLLPHAGVNPVDYKVRQGDVSLIVNLKFPAILGIDYAGTIAAVGSAVTGFKVGDAVYGKTAGVDGKGVYAEYVKLSTVTDVVVPLPKNVLPEQAAGVVTYNALSLNAEENKGKKVLVIGASGGVGIFTVQIAKLLGAHVTAVASAKNKDFVVSQLGADAFVDYTAKPIAEQFTEKNYFDVIYDTVGGDEGKNWELAQTILKPNGLFVTSAASHHGPVTVGSMAGIVGSMAWRGLTNSRKYKFIFSLPVDQFPNVAKWIEEGKLKLFTTVTLPLADVKKAHEMSASGRTVGKIVLVV